MKKYIIVVFLVISAFISCLVTAHAANPKAVFTVITTMLKYCTEDVNSDEDAWVEAYNHINTVWQSYSNVQSMGRLYLSYDSMSALAVELNNSGFPCRLEWVRNLQVYAICGVDEVSVVSGANITGKYLTNGSRDLYCCLYDIDSYIVDISSKLSTISDTLSKWPSSLSTVSTISTNLYNFQTNVQNALAKLYSKVSNLSDAATGYYDSQVYSDLPTMFSRMAHDYYYGTADERTAISAAFDRYWLTSMSSGKSYVSPEVLNDICADLNKANIRCSVYYDADLGLSYIKGLGGPYIVDPSDWNPSGAAFDALSTNGRILAIRDLAIVSSTRSVSYYVSNMLTKVSSMDTRLSTLHTDATGLAGKLDSMIDLLQTDTYMCSFKSDATGTAYPTRTIPYDMAVQIAARINSQMIGKKATVLKRDGSGTVSITVSRCQIDNDGYIIVRSDTTGYYLCGKDNTIFIADQDYTKSIYSRLSDVITAVNNLTVGVDLSDVSLSVDASSINLFNNTAYCCGYLTDADGNDYPRLPIPYDSAAAMVERLNTDYVDKKITVLTRTGTTFTSNLKHAYIASSGVINVRLTNGYGYALCDSANTIYQADSATNYGSRANDSLLNVSSKLDAILDQMQSSGGEYTCQHTYSQEMEQEPTCILPGLMVSTCSKCGNSYSEIVGALDHDWVCTEHVEAVTDPDTEEVTQAAYDIYTCSRCGQTYEDHTGDGAPTDYGETSIAKIIVKLFAKLGTFAGKIISWVVDLFTKTLGGINDLFARFTELTAQITGFGGDYPTWLSGFWGVLSPDLQLALSFAFLCTFVGIIGKKLFFA